MKRRFALSVILLFATATTLSCVKDKKVICPVENNVVMSFRIQNMSDAELDRRLNEITMILFDDRGFYVTSKKVTDPHATGTSGANFILPSGTYYMVCWANAGENSKFIDDEGSILSNLDNNTYIEDLFIEIDGTTTGDPIYYAPYRVPEVITGGSRVKNSRADEDPYAGYRIEVKEGQPITNKEMVFVKAHRTVDVYITGYEQTPGYDGRPPVIETAGACGRFNFLLQAENSGDVTTLRQTTEPIIKEGISTFNAKFYTGNVPLASDDEINIYHPSTNALLNTINLQDFVTAHAVEDTSHIEIEVRYDNSGDTAVSITMPSWKDNEIFPGF